MRRSDAAAGGEVRVTVPVPGGGLLAAAPGGAPLAAVRFALDRGPLAPSKARRLARRALADWGVGQERGHDVLVVISELVTNAVEHATPPVDLCLDPFRGAAAQGAVRISVTDGGAALTRGEWVAGCGVDERGRGRAVVEALASGAARPDPGRCAYRVE
ncbi:ATP-binding protein [Streptomyces sp. NPDC017993]|uniref:ATP-binding protein n=1 Tax=Streptomyces sp. NPDC017993 TaxID=3365027 RepID=UPI00379C424D